MAAVGPGTEQCVIDRIRALEDELTQARQQIVTLTIQNHEYEARIEELQMQIGDLKSGYEPGHIASELMFYSRILL